MVLINGINTRTIDVADRGFQYADGIFETIAVQNGIPIFLSRHLQRARDACDRLFIPFPGNKILRQEIDGLCGSTANGVLKIQLTRGIGGRGYRPPDRPEVTRVLSLHPIPDYPDDLQTKGISAILCRTRLGHNPQLAGIKHMNRLEQVLARNEWKDDQIHEGLMLDQMDCIVEGTMSNLFLVKNGILHTPKVDRCGVAGIIRSLVIECANQHGNSVNVTRMSIKDIDEADELFVTNSIIVYWPIRMLGNTRFRVGPVTTKVGQWLSKSIQNELKRV